jgi:hypothetical protein
MLETDFSPDLIEHINNADDERVRFKLRARTRGWEEYTCVFCGWNNKFQMGPSTWTNRCGSELCRRWMGFGRVGYVLPRSGVHVAPPDLTIPRNLIEAYPEGDLARWKNGDTIHVVRMLGPWRTE